MSISGALFEQEIFLFDNLTHIFSTKGDLFYPQIRIPEHMQFGQKN